MIDPRPYTYEYRKPRLNNPTYRSSNMYDSLYHLRFPSNSNIQFTLPRQRKINNEPKTISPSKQSPRNDYNPERYELRQTEIKRQPIHMRQQSMDSREQYNFDKGQRNNSLNREIVQKMDSRFQDPSYRQNNGTQSHLSNYGDSLMKSSQFNRFQVYQKQQKGFNIINLQPREMSNSLRNFPKYTLEDKLIEKGRYNRM